MIRGEKYFFFRLTPIEDGLADEYRIAKSFEDLYVRFGFFYMSKFHSIVKLNEVTIEHIRAIDEFLLQQLS